MVEGCEWRRGLACLPVWAAPRCCDALGPHAALWLPAGRSVEMSVTPEYQVRPPMKPTHFFLIDVSQPAVASGATAAVCSSVARILDDLPGGERTQVGTPVPLAGGGRAASGWLG